MTFEYSAHSIAQRATLHPDLQVLCDHVLLFHDFKIQEGFRGKPAQEIAFVEGHTKLHFPHGKHNKNPSNAVDLWPFLDGAFIGFPDHISEPKKREHCYRQWVWFCGIVRGVAHMLHTTGEMEHAVRLGADWNGNNLLTDQTFNDLPHVELAL